MTLITHSDSIVLGHFPIGCVTVCKKRKSGDSTEREKNEGTEETSYSYQVPQVGQVNVAVLVHLHHLHLHAGHLSAGWVGAVSRLGDETNLW